MKFIRAIAGIAIFCLGIYALSTVVAGIKNGEIMQFSKRGNAIMHRTREPDRFWIAISFWSIGTVMLIGGGINMLRKSL
jgi:hypothetical protein